MDIETHVTPFFLLNVAKGILFMTLFLYFGKSEHQDSKFKMAAGGHIENVT